MREARVLGKRRPQAFEVTGAKRDGPATRSAGRRVGEANELLSLATRKELDDDGEPLLARALRDG